MPAPPWAVQTGLSSVVERWLSSGAIRPCLAADRGIAAKAASYADLPEDLAPGLADALARRGISRLYSHQARAIEAARQGRNVVIATPTASGKSLCFHLPVIDAITRDPTATALYLYPTKALARDQEASAQALVREAGLTIPAIVFDGDTPGDARRAARERSSIVMTNPDMLHAGILPNHAHWARALQKLRYVVVDELHTYRGVFGSHVAHVLARLRRAARFHGADPIFLSATATIGNGRAHAAKLFGVEESDVTLVDESGAPAGERRIFLYNPPVVNAELGIRQSTWKSAVSLAADLCRARVPTIVFGQSRNAVEVMVKYLRDALANERLDEGAIMAYRGGYLPEVRRGIERGLREGEILCVVATNALELGIDIGDLDAVICAGYPGSIAGTWQRFGRAGRRGTPSIGVLITSSAGVDQYLARTPEALFDGAVESARIDPSNTEILIQHLKCAAFELPFLGDEPYAVLPPSDTGAALGFLSDHGVVHAAPDGRFHWSTDAYPANHVSLRSVGWDNVVIIDKAKGRVLGELDFRAAHTMLHDQAIYQHDGEQYQVERLDYENHKAYVTKVEPDYFTTALTRRKVSVIDVTADRPLRAAKLAWGEVSVVEKVVGFKKIKFFTHENTGYGEVRLPDIQKHTTSFMLTVPLSLCPDTALRVEGLRGVGAALEAVSCLALMCDPHDLGQSLGDTGEEATGFDPTVFLFDNVPGGVGLAERIYERAEELLNRARALVLGCSCEGGCPSCVGAGGEPGVALSISRRRAASLLFERIVG